MYFGASRRSRDSFSARFDLRPNGIRRTEELERATRAVISLSDNPSQGTFFHTPNRQTVLRISIFFENSNSNSPKGSSSPSGSSMFISRQDGALSLAYREIRQGSDSEDEDEDDGDD